MKNGWTYLALTFCVFCLCAAGHDAVAQNLISDGAFDQGITNWTPGNSNVTIEHATSLGSTLNGGSGPGSLRLANALLNGGSGGAWHQYVTVSPDTYYELAATYMLPGCDNPARSVRIEADWYDGQSEYIDESYTYLEVSARDRWLRLSGVFRSPVGAASARFWVRVASYNNPDTTSPAVAYFDDVWFAPAQAEEWWHELFAPAAAAVHGLLGTYWSTDGSVSNLTSANVSVEAAFLRQGQDNSAAVQSPTVIGTIPPYGSMAFTDIVSTLGGSEVAGGLYFVAKATAPGLSLPLVTATTRTFTPNPYGDGVYGQGIPAVERGDTAVTAVADVRNGSDFRTNVGALNTSYQTISLEVKVISAAGTQLAATTWTLQPFEQRQVSLESLGVANITDGTVIFTLSGNGSYRAYGSTIDQDSGDAVYNEAR